MLQNRLHGLDGLWLGDTFLQHLWLKLPDHLSVFHKLFHETRLHHLTIVGYGIIETDGIDGCYLRLITNTHPRQCGLTPILSPVGRLRVWHTDIRRLITYEGNLQVFVDTHPVQTLDIFRRITAIELIDHVTDTNIRTDLQGTGYIDVLIPTTAPVVIFHRTPVHLHHTTARMDNITGINHPIVESHKEGGDLKHRSWLATETDCPVHHFVIPSVTTPFHIDDGFNIARLYFHQDSDAHLTINLFQFINDGMLSQILHTHIDGSHDIGTIDRVQDGNIHILVQHLPTVHHTIGSTEDRVKREFETILCTVFRTKHIANGALSQ